MEVVLEQDQVWKVLLLTLLLLLLPSHKDLQELRILPSPPLAPSSNGEVEEISDGDEEAEKEEGVSCKQQGRQHATARPVCVEEAGGRSDVETFVAAVRIFRSQAAPLLALFPPLVLAAAVPAPVPPPAADLVG
eukprot:755142-Hanusia_phi.AAC.9